VLVHNSARSRPRKISAVPSNWCLLNVSDTVAILAGWTAVPGAGARVYLQSAARQLSHPARLECSGGTFITRVHLQSAARQLSHPARLECSGGTFITRVYL
jgi:hypothetical protein